MSSDVTPNTEETKPEPKNVVEALARIMGELGPIGKDNHSDDIPYAFRSIEDMTAKAQVLCARYGVVFIPRAEITEVREFTQRSGNVWSDVFMSVEWEICHGPSDTSKIARVPAIGRDNSDKGSNKGMTQALKYVLMPVLMISDPREDGDYERAENEGGAAVAETQIPEWETLGWNTQEELTEKMLHLRELWEKITDDNVRKVMRDWLKEHGYSQRFPVKFEHYAEYESGLMAAPGVEETAAGGPPPTEEPKRVPSAPGVTAAQAAQGIGPDEEPF